MQDLSCCKASFSCGPCFSVTCCNNSRRYSSIRCDIIIRHPVCCILLLVVNVVVSSVTTVPSYILLTWPVVLSSITDIPVVEEDSLVFNSDFSVKVRLFKEFPIDRVFDVILVDAIPLVAVSLLCITPWLLVVDSPALKMVKI